VTFSKKLESKLVKDFKLLSDNTLFKMLKPKEDTESTKEKRVEKVIQNIEFEQNTNDIITFAVSKSFSTLMTLLAPLFALFGKYSQK
jgi:hypothetical protein